MTKTDEIIQGRLGTMLREKWLLERLLGSGGMAAVYVGVHKIGRRDAIKMLHPEAAKSREICRRFEREAAAVNRFRHPGAVEIRDIDVAEDGTPFLVMELLEGETLRARVDRAGGRMSLSELLDVVEQVLDVLVAAHAQGIIHRDIKPENLFVLAGHRIKVLDFGVARVRQGNIDGAWTRTGTTLGTTAFMPPEQARGRDIDGRADVFAVGATMFRLLTGRRIHESDSDYDLLMKMAKEHAPALASVAPSVPSDVCRVVDRALAFEREQRQSSVAAMLEEVRALRRADPSRVYDAGASVHMVTVKTGDPPSIGSPATSDEIPVIWSSVLTPGLHVDGPTPELDPTRFSPVDPERTDPAPPAVAIADVTALSPGTNPDDPLRRS